MSKKELFLPGGIFASKKAIWNAIIILIVSISIPLIPVGMFYYSSIWALKADFGQYSEDFIVVKDYVAARYPNADKYLSVSIRPDKSVTLFDPDTQEYLQLPDNVASSLATIDRYAFPHKDSDLEIIEIEGSRITFLIFKGSYALVYSPDERPTRHNSIGRGESFHVKDIGDGWYHVSTRG